MSKRHSLPQTGPVARSADAPIWLAALETAALLVGREDLRVRAMNAAAERLLGIPRDQGVGGSASVVLGTVLEGDLHAEATRTVRLPLGAAAPAARLSVAEAEGGSLLVLAWPCEPTLAPPGEAAGGLRMEDLAQAVFRTDEWGRLTAVNRAWVDALGDEVEVSRGRAFLGYVHPEDRDRARRLLLDPLLRGERDQARQTLRCVTRAGATRWMDVWARSIPEPHGGVGLTGTLVDVTDAHLAHQALLRRDAILEAVAYASERLLREDSLPTGMQDVLARLGEATQVSRIYVFQNHRADDGRLLLSQRYEWTAPGVAPQIGNPELQGFSWEDAGFYRWLDVMGRGEPVHGRVRDFPDNERALLEPQQIRSLLAMPIYASDEWWGFIGFDDCIVERTWSGVEVDALRSAAGTIGAALERQRVQEERLASLERLREIEQLRQEDRFKTQFLNIAAHELGTPLTPIKLQLHMLKSQGGLTPKQERALAVLDRNIERLAALVQDILDGARLQAGHLRVVLEPLDLDHVVDDALESFHATARAQGVELVRERAHDRAARVQGDPRRLAQVLFNLLSNALRFTPRGGRIVVESRLEHGRAVVRVRDTGAGLSGSQLSRLFQPFTQVHDELREAQNGTGLGLFISRGILEEHGGSIWAESDGPGKGSTFAFALPVRPPSRR